MRGSFVLVQRDRRAPQAGRLNGFSIHSSCNGIQSRSRAIELPAVPHETYESPLASRNASPEMLRLFSAQHKFGLWRRLWLELARAEKELGLSRISDEAIRQMEAKVDAIDFD